MANYASILIDFNAVAIVGTAVDISINGDSIALTAVDVAPQPGEFFAGLSAEESAADYFSQITDLLGGLPFDITVSQPSATSVLIDATEFGVVFTQNTTQPYYSTTITSEVLGIVINSLTTTEHDEPANRKYNVKHTLNLSNAIYPISIKVGNLAPFVSASAATDWFYFQRYTPGGINNFDRRVEVTGNDGSTDFAIIPNVEVWEHDGVDVISGPTTGQATIKKVTLQVGDLPISFQYAMAFLEDGVETTFYPFQPSPTFSDLPLGWYRSYIADSYGDVSILTFEIIASSVPVYDFVAPFARIENTNGLKFYHPDEPIFDRKKWNTENYVNIEDQCFAQLVKQSNIIKTQVKSSYSTVTARCYDDMGNEVATWPAQLKKQNTKLRDMRDCQLWQGADTDKTYITFAGGNTYDPTTDLPNGSYFNGYWPEWAYVGMYVDLAVPLGAVYQVTEIVYFAAQKKYALVVAETLGEVGPVFATCKSYYNAEPYNIFEFAANMSALDSGIYRIDVEFTDPNFTTVVWTGEEIALDAHDSLVEVLYTNDEPIEQIDYSTGIEHILNVRGRFVKWEPSNTIDRFADDKGQVVNLKAINSRLVVLEANMMPQYVADKLVSALMHGTVTIDGTAVKLFEDIEVSNLMDANNPFYNVTAKMQLMQSTTITNNIGITTSSRPVIGVAAQKVLGV